MYPITFSSSNPYSSTNPQFGMMKIKKPNKNKGSSSSSSLPDPRESFFFRITHVPEAIHNVRKQVAVSYPDKPVVTVFDGDYRGKDSFSARCVDIEAGLAEGIKAKDVLATVTGRNPFKRRDIHKDDLKSSQSIQYDPDTEHFIDALLEGEQTNSLSKKAAQRAQHQLEKNGPPKHGRAQLTDSWISSLGSSKEVDVFAPIASDKKTKRPSVHSSQSIWHYGDPKQQKQYAQNLQDTQSQGSFLVVGGEEAMEMKDRLPDLLQRHGYTPDEGANSKIRTQWADNN